MDIGIFVGIIALCIACFSADVQYGKEHSHKEMTAPYQVAVISYD